MNSGADQKPATSARIYDHHRPAPDDPQDFRDRPELAVGFGAVGRKLELMAR